MAADKFLNLTAVQTIKTWATSLFSTKTELQTLDDKVDGIIADGGEPNVIETVKVNNTALVPDAQKAVNIPVPTKVSDLMNDGDGTSGSAFATEAYVDQNGGKIDNIAVNGTDQTITNKRVSLTIPTSSTDLSDGATIAHLSDIPDAVSDLTNDSGYQTASDVQSAIASGVASAVKIKGSVASYSALPASGNQHGDMYDTLDTGKNYVWIEESGTGRWDDYAGTMDLSAYWISTTGQTNTLEAATVTEINAILNA